MPESFRVTLNRVVFQAVDSPFAVIAGADPEDRPVTLTGELGSFREGDRLEVTGRRTNHPRFGERWEVENALLVEPDDRRSRLAFLESIDGIGPGRASLLLEAHGDSIFERIDEAPERVFRELPAVGEKTARKAARSWRSRRQIRELLTVFQEAAMDSPHSLASRVVKTFGDRAREVLSQDPFALLDLPGVGFREADRLATFMGIPPDSFRRMGAGIIHVLREAKGSEGHLFLNETDLASRLAPLLGLPPESLHLKEVVDATSGIVESEGRFYTSSAYHAETNFAADIWTLATDMSRTVTVNPDELDPSLTESQRYAVAGCLGQRLTLISGPPGVGKTTIIRELCRVARKEALSVALTAPTGRAATRMSQAAGTPAATVHRLLGLRGDGAPPEKNAGNPLTADLVICDEASMLDVELAAKLTDALDDNARLVLVGDADQLPPPGAGDALAELLASPAISHFELTNVFRQADRSTLLRAAAKIRLGKVPSFQARPEDVADVTGFWSHDAQQLLGEAVRQARQVLPAKLGIPPDEVQVIAPMYRGPAGIDQLNESLRLEANPHGREIMRGRLRVGDRLIQTRNDYNLVAGNGEPFVNGAFCQIVGEREGSDRGIEVLCEDGSEMFIPASQTNSLKLGYAISVHKSQGSEWPATVVVLPPCPESSFLTRRLLRTALTRARQHCHVVACPTTFRAAVGRADQSVRNCAVVERIEASFERAIQRELVEADALMA